MGDLSLSDRLENYAARAVLGGAMALPYRARVKAVGWVVARIVAPLAGWRKRIRMNLALTHPDMPRAEVARLERAVPDTVGRTLIEIYSGREFVERVKDTPLTGPGVEALEAAHRAGQPMVLITGHIGNYDVLRAVLYERGYQLAGLYKPMENKAFNDHYLKAVKAIGEPVYPTDRQGITSLIRHLASGKAIGIVADVASRKAPKLRFFGRPAHTPLSAAEWAVKHDALMVPMFGLRSEDRSGFRIHVADPIEHGDPAAMMQAFNDTLEAVVRQNMDQWYWIHRRWKTRGRAAG